MCCIEYFIVSRMKNNKKIPITLPLQKLASVHDACHGQYLHSDWFKKLM